jgi:hypothetical protein
LNHLLAFCLLALPLASARAQTSSPHDDGTFTGLSSGLARIYRAQPQTTFGAFGEVHYTTLADSSSAEETAETSVTRLTPFFGHRFTRQLVFNSAISFEAHEPLDSDGTGRAFHAARVSFAYLDFLFGDETGVRVGNFLIPVGITNLRPEPQLFLLTSRPRPETSIIPTTWNENGLLGFTRLGPWVLQAGVVNGARATGFETGTWIRGGRQHGAGAGASSAAAVFRLERTGPASTFGLSMYSGGSGQNVAELGSARVDLASIHGELSAGPFAVRALYAEGRLSDTDRLFAVTNRSVGSRARGGYVILSYDLLSRRPAPLPRILPIFLAWEYDDPYAEPALGQPASEDFRSERVTFGINYRPHPDAVVKTDLVHRFRGDRDPDWILQAAIGFVF